MHSNNNLYSCASEDFKSIDNFIKKYLFSRVPLVSEIGEYITSKQGKRLRPLLVILCGKSLGKEGNDLSLLAAIIEFLHTATLLHDDVVDQSNMRRGHKTVNAAWDNSPSILVGDFVYSRSFEMMVQLNSMPIMRVLSHATRVIVEAEVLQLSKIQDFYTTEETYLEVIKGKTAMLFEAATHSAAILAEATYEQIEAMRKFGTYIGMSFQLIDDLLDYQGDSKYLGKNIGGDLAEGKPTLPLIHTMREGTAMQAEIVRNAIKSRNSHHLDAVIQAVNDAGSLRYTKDLAQKYASNAIKCLKILDPRSKYHQALIDFSNFTLSRVQ